MLELFGLCCATVSGREGVGEVLATPVRPTINPSTHPPSPSAGGRKVEEMNEKFPANRIWGSGVVRDSAPGGQSSDYDRNEEERRHVVTTHNGSNSYKTIWFSKIGTPTYQ